MIDQHQQCAEEVWSALPRSIREEMSHEDFLLGFFEGRVSMKACFDKAEIQETTQNQETNTNER